MITSFKYLSPIQDAYSRVVESEADARRTKEILDSKKGSPYRMSDEERMLFYQDEIKRLRQIQKYYEQQRKYSLRNVAPQGAPNYALQSTIEKYQRELEKMKQKQAQNANQEQTNAVPDGIQPSQPPQPASLP